MKKKILCLLLLISVFSASLFLNVNKTENENFTPNTEYFDNQIAAGTPSVTSASVVVSGVNTYLAVNIANASSAGSLYVGWNTDSINSAYAVPVNGRSTIYVGAKAGVYRFWLSSTGSTTGTLGAVKQSVSVNVAHSQACSNEIRNNQTGSGTLESCYVSLNGSGAQLDGDGLDKRLSCASGYTKTVNITKNDCNKTLGYSNVYGGQNIIRAYCRVVVTYNCTKGGSTTPVTPNPPSVPAATLSSLSVDGYALSPGFNAGTKKYTVNVGAEVTSIAVNAAVNNGSFVNGFGPRAVNLNYGANNVVVKVQNSAGAVNQYTIVVNRADNRNANNYLSELVFSYGTLSPAFNAEVQDYNLVVPYNIERITVDGKLADPTAAFVAGFGPRIIDLTVGLNPVQVKLANQRGEQRVYTINVTRQSLEDSVCINDIDKMAYLKEIKLVSDIDGVDIDQIDFAYDKYNYTVKVPYEVQSLIIQAFVQDEGDEIDITGNEDLEVNIEKEITITVTNKNCKDVSRKYTLNVTRSQEYHKSDNADISSITIKDHEEFNFEENVFNYKLKLNKGEESLDIEVVPVDTDKTTCEITGNENLEKGSQIVISCLSEDETNDSIYTIDIIDVETGPSVFWVIIIVIIIILVLIYLVLRLMGYRIYFNFGAIGAFFRGIGEKFNNLFE